MKLFLTSLTLIIVSAISAFAQNAATQTENCSDQTIKKISSRGISIGADLNDVLNLLGLTEENKQQFLNSSSGNDNDRFGFKFFSVGPNQNLQKQNEKFDGISDYVLTSLDNRLVGFVVNYTKPIWRNNEQFTTKIGETLNLPDVKNWNIRRDNNFNLQCGNYTIGTYTSGRSSLRIDDNRIGQILEQRKRKAADEQLEKDLKTFKP